MLNHFLQKSTLLAIILLACGCAKEPIENLQDVLYHTETDRIKKFDDFRGTLPQSIEDTEEIAYAAGDDREPETITTTYYFENNNLVRVVTSNGYLVKAEYNKENKIVLLDLCTFDNDIERSYNKTTYTYDDNSKLIEQTNYINDSDIADERKSYTLHKDGFDILSESETNGNFVKNHVLKYRFNKENEHLAVDYKMDVFLENERRTLMHNKEVWDQQLKPIEIVNLLSGNATTTYIYNEKGYIAKKEISTESEAISLVLLTGNYGSKSEFAYEYDEKENWTKCIEKIDDGKIVTTTRKILY